MAATISVPALRLSSRAGRFITIGLEFLAVALMAGLARYGLIALALAVLVLAETWPVLVGRRWSLEDLLARSMPLIVGASVIVTIALLPKALTQLTVALLYAGWRAWRAVRPAAAPTGFWELLVLQAVVFVAVFLAADIWHLPRPLTLVMIWVSAFTIVRQALAGRGERSAGVLAAAWALVATEASWVFLTWMVSYVVAGYYIIVPQAALVLTALAYCFGNIYMAQRTGSLNRARFTEYLLIGLILMWIVIAGTRWHGTL